MSTNTKIHSDLAEQLELRRRQYMAKEWLHDLAEREESEQRARKWLDEMRRRDFAEQEQTERVHSARVFPLLLVVVVVLSALVALWRSC